MDNEKKMMIVASGWRRYTYVEPLIFLLFLCSTMTGVIFTDLMIYRTCQISYPENKTICDILHTNSTSEEAINLVKIVQPHASYISLVNTIISGLVPAILILFLGPWSDKYGRKPLLITGYIGATLHYFVILILYKCDVNPWMYLIASVPTCLCGGNMGCLLAVFCYISDITTNEERSSHMACAGSFITGGMITGTLIGPLIYQQFGYTILFLTASFVSAIALLHIVFFVPESVQNEDNVKWGNPFDFRFVKQLFETPIKKRPGLNRWALWCCISILCLQGIIGGGSGSINYLFVNARLGWNSVQYSIYQSVSMILSAIGTISGVKLIKDFLGVPDVIVALVGSTLSFSVSIISSCILKPWHLYVATCVGVFSGVVGPSIQSILSTSVPADDIGKIFSLLMFLEALLPMGGASLYTLVYTNFMPPVYPSPVYLMSAGFVFIIIVLIIMIDRNLIRCRRVLQNVDQE